jgi:hypothetical protein
VREGDSECDDLRQTPQQGVLLRDYRFQLELIARDKSRLGRQTKLWRPVAAGNHNFPIEIKDFRHFLIPGCGAYSYFCS